MSQVWRRLERNKKYPRQARERHVQGTVEVRFTVDRQGRVTSSHISRSSNHQ
ncbi:MAG: TonB family protein, partial [Deltaproteobacteria bacterium]|nr:TonB family protein [Deltaproteobacteria bacterium]